MSVYRAQIALQLDTEFPRDAMTINPHYEGSNPQAIANALKTKLLAHPNVGAVQPFHIKIYDAEKPPPSYPLAAADNAVPTRPSGAPRELAMCLSYYSGFNRPRLRGRLFIPGTLLGGTPQTRPSLAQQNAAMAWADVFNIGSNTGIWVVWSRTEKLGSVVTNVWVDDEWDCVRSRGLDPTSRVAAPVTQ